MPLVSRALTSVMLPIQTWGIQIKIGRGQTLTLLWCNNYSVWWILLMFAVLAGELCGGTVLSFRVIAEGTEKRRKNEILLSKKFMQKTSRPSKAFWDNSRCWTLFHESSAFISQVITIQTFSLALLIDHDEVMWKKQ